ncbi:MAG: DUF6797 domain-containing protein [Planctomycetaceae bacterium]
MIRSCMLAAVGVCFSASAAAQTLEQQLLSVPPTSLADAARETGDAKRGAILFHQAHIGCVKCHAVDGSSNALGPDLTKLKTQPDATDEYLVTSLLNPSASIRKGFESATVVTNDGKTHVGLLVSQTAEGVVIRDAAQTGVTVSFAANDVDEVIPGKLSIMPAGIVNQLGSRQQFLDLLRYVIEVRDGGLPVARTLQPPPGLIAFNVPEYESHVDHAGLIRKLDNSAFERGQQIYERLCINCHGDKQKPGSLPTALRFAEGKFRNGSDPHTMYKTLTHGFGFMTPQTWMVPQQKYDVVHYIRESYLKDNNASQYVAVSDSYLSALPKGDTFGPEPVEYAPWSDMIYGPSMINTFEVGSDGTNFAHKGIAIRLDTGPGGISKGNRWAMFDHDTLRLVAAWTRNVESKAAGFINWQGIHFDGRHGTHPRVVGDVLFANTNGPGWAKPGSTSFADDERVSGRDNRKYGPLPADWAKYTGLHTLGNQTIIEYTVGGRPILERLGAVDIRSHQQVPRDPLHNADSQPTNENESETSNASHGDVVLTRTMSLAASGAPNMLLVATHPEKEVSYRPVGKYSAVLCAQDSSNSPVAASEFNGASWLQVDDATAFDMTTRDFTIAARLRTNSDGVIFSRCNADGPWTPGSKAFFIRGGRLTYDIGWVGAVTSKKRVDDGQWHDVVMTWNHKTGRINFFIDGRKNGGGNLKPKTAEDSGHVAKIGFAAGNFPATSFFTGKIDSLAVLAKDLSGQTQDPVPIKSLANASPIAMWSLGTAHLQNQETITTVHARGGTPIAAKVIRGTGPQANKAIFAGVVGSDSGFAFSTNQNRLHLSCPSGRQPENVVLWTVSVPADLTLDELKAIEDQIQHQLQPEDLQARINAAGNARWPEVINTTPVMGSDDGPFAIDVLTPPVSNPWLTRLRFTGHDFFDDADRLATCCWDGDVWLVSGLKTMKELKWQRIASGLFQPLGLKIVDGTIYVTCRDQLVILRDRNGDGETDFYECFNNDHQVTEHFHEFAMGLQRDDQGNFYYAKSARHALTAVVPHHGTLLRIPPDGSRTDIVANGFRAANGVCLNPDGSFIVTDQEGHWNPKNRINWVREGGFYGNMFGYHDVTDDSDEAMEQPLCWITNAFDRSPAELMWINNKAWGTLNGTLLNLSYGYGKVYVVPHEDIDGQMQGGMCELPIPQFPTGITRGRISPHDNGLYLGGMFAWGSSQQSLEGGLYRLRFTGKPAHLPVGLSASGKELKITFTDRLNPAAATSKESYTIKVWSLQRSANYGSKHFNEHEIAVASAALSKDGKAVTLTVPELSETWCMEIVCRLKSADGEDVSRVIHNTIHRLK